MPENQYVRQVSLTILELVPQRDNLPDCVGWKLDATQCEYKARYDVNGNPSCGVHIRSLLFMPARLRRKNHASV